MHIRSGWKCLLGLVLFAAVALAQPTYQMRCRGTPGRGMSTVVEKSNLAGFYKFTLTFQRGTKPADAGLRPGECSWIDRGFRPGEPDRIVEVMPEKESYLNYLNSTGNYWTFYVFNTGQGFFRATKSHAGWPMNF